MYLLDTVILSEMRKRRRHAGVVRWLRGKSQDTLFVSAVTIGEIERGIDRQRAQNPVFAEALGSWLDRLIDLYDDRILPVDVAVARCWGRLSARIGHGGADLLIAATALEHGFIVATRNVRDFQPTGVSFENPYGD
jgi:predicted nucleic acid-binding protein